MKLLEYEVNVGQTKFIIEEAYYKIPLQCEGCNEKLYDITVQEHTSEINENISRLIRIKDFTMCKELIEKNFRINLDELEPINKNDGKHYTEKDKSIIRYNYRKISVKEISRILKRSEYLVRNYIYTHKKELGL